MTWRDRRRFWRIVFNFNFPLLLWISAAGLSAGGVKLLDHCYIKETFGFCFGCGLTHDLVELVTVGKPHGTLIYFVIAGFSLNLIQSLRAAYIQNVYEENQDL